MSNKKEVTQTKKETANVSNDQKRLNEILSKFTEREISQRKESIYKDTEHLKTFDGGKRWRNAQRKKLERLSFAFFSAMKSANKEKQKETFANFENFYKESYILNDFSIASVYSGSNPAKIEYLQDVFEVCKIYLSSVK